MLRLIQAPLNVTELADEVKEAKTVQAVDEAIAEINELWNLDPDALEGVYEVGAAVNTMRRKERYDYLYFPIQGKFESEGHRWLYGAGFAFSIDSEIGELQRIRVAIAKQSK